MGVQGSAQGNVQPTEASTAPNPGDSSSAPNSSVSDQWTLGLLLPLEELIGEESSLFTGSQQLSLVFNEVLMRKAAGQAPTLAEYQQRFPRLAHDLANQWHNNSELASAIFSAEKLAVKPIEFDAQLLQRYQLHELIGSGAMGEVYRALDKRLGRVVALKRLKGSGAAHASTVERFRREAAIIAKIDHPHVVRVYDSEGESTEHVISMEYCAGGSLAAWLREGPLPARVAAQVALQIAKGIQAAHARKILHRDLKPGNVLLTDTPKLESLHVKVSDFGLAKQIGGDGDTMSNEFVGTAAYMPPEQTKGGESSLSPLIDIYAIGAVLYECLTGRPPIRGATQLETLQLLAVQDAVPLRKLQPNVPVDLASITHKCLEREPSVRYQSAQALADDLQRFLNNQPTLARPTSWPQRSVKWARRNPALAASMLALSLVIIGLLAMWGRFTGELQEKNKTIVTEKENVEKAKDRAERNMERAQRNKDWAMEAVDKFITLVGEKQLADIPGANEIRKQLLLSAVEFSNRFLDDSESENLDAINDVGLAHRRLAKIYRLLGDDQEALSQLQSAVAMHRKVVGLAPDNLSFLNELGKSLNNLSNAQSKTVGVKKSLETAEEAIRLKEKLVALDPKSADYRKSLATSYYGISPKLRAIDPDKTELYSQKAESLLVDLVNELPDDIDNIRSLAVMYSNRFAMLVGQGRLSEAEACALKKKELWETALRRSPSPMFQQEVFECLDSLAYIKSVTNDYKGAIELHRQAFEGQRQMMREHPDDVSYSTACLSTGFNLANIQYEDFQFAEAQRTIQSILEDYPSGSRPAVADHKLLMRLQALNAQVENDAGDPTKALELLRSLPDWQDGHATYEMRQLEIEALIALKQFDDARARLDKLCPELFELVKAQPREREPARLMLLAANECILLALQSRDFQTAEKVCEQARVCTPADRQPVVSLMQAAIDAWHGEHAAAAKAVEGFGKHPEITAIHTDHLPTVILTKCLEDVQTDQQLTSDQKQPLVDQYQNLRDELLKHASTTKWRHSYSSRWK